MTHSLTRGLQDEWLPTALTATSWHSFLDPSCRVSAFRHPPRLQATCTNHSSQMIEVHRKSQLPTKLCPACQRSFAWRKKWQKVWEQVRYCSERCRRQPHIQAGR